MIPYESTHRICVSRNNNFSNSNKILKKIGFKNSGSQTPVFSTYVCWYLVIPVEIGFYCIWYGTVIMGNIAPYELQIG